MVIVSLILKARDALFVCLLNLMESIEHPPIVFYGVLLDLHLFRQFALQLFARG